MQQQHDLRSAIYHLICQHDEFPADGDPDSDPAYDDLEREFAHLRLQQGNR